MPSLQPNPDQAPTPTPTLTLTRCRETCERYYVACLATGDEPHTADQPYGHYASMQEYCDDRSRDTRCLHVPPSPPASPPSPPSLPSPPLVRDCSNPTLYDFAVCLPPAPPPYEGGLLLWGLGYWVIVFAGMLLCLAICCCFAWRRIRRDKRYEEKMEKLRRMTRRMSLAASGTRRRMSLAAGLPRRMSLAAGVPRRMSLAGKGRAAQRQRAVEGFVEPSDPETPSARGMHPCSAPISPETIDQKLRRQSVELAALRRTYPHKLGAPQGGGMLPRVAEPDLTFAAREAPPPPPDPNPNQSDHLSNLWSTLRSSTANLLAFVSSQPAPAEPLPAQDGPTMAAATALAAAVARAAEAEARLLDAHVRERAGKAARVEETATAAIATAAVATAEARAEVPGRGAACEDHHAIMPPQEHGTVPLAIDAPLPPGNPAGAGQSCGAGQHHGTSQPPQQPQQPRQPRQSTADYSATTGCYYGTAAQQTQQQPHHHHLQQRQHQHHQHHQRHHQRQHQRQHHKHHQHHKPHELRVLQHDQPHQAKERPVDEDITA